MIRILGHHKVKINLKERKKTKNQNQKCNTHLIFSINSVDVSGSYGNKLIKEKKIEHFVLFVDAQYALNTRAARV